MDKGIIRVACAYCHITQKVEVIFPQWNRGFTDQPFTCEDCGEAQIAYDPHTYHDDGTITEYDYGNPADYAETA